MTGASANCCHLASDAVAHDRVHLAPPCGVDHAAPGEPEHLLGGPVTSIAPESAARPRTTSRTPGRARRIRSRLAAAASPSGTAKAKWPLRRGRSARSPDRTRAGSHPPAPPFVASSFQSAKTRSDSAASAWSPPGPPAPARRSRSRIPTSLSKRRHRGLYVRRGTKLPHSGPGVVADPGTLAQSHHLRAWRVARGPPAMTSYPYTPIRPLTQGIEPGRRGGRRRHALTRDPIRGPPSQARSLGGRGPPPRALRRRSASSLPSCMHAVRSGRHSR